MLKNYFKTAFRNLIKQKVYTAINLAGLAVSITACLLIVLYVKHELSYDRFFQDSERIYKLNLERKYPNHITHYSIVPHSFGKVIQQDFPEVERVLHFFRVGDGQIITYRVNDSEVKSFEGDFVIQSDSSFFDFFDLEFVKGNKKTALILPNQVIISEAIAVKYFGKEEPIGKVLGGDFGELKVSGVFKSIPGNSHLRLELISSVAGADFAQFINQENYTGFDAHIYVKLKPGADVGVLEAKFPKMVDQYAAGGIEHNLGKSWEEYKKEGNGYIYTLQPLTSIHLDPKNLEWTITPSGNIRYVYIMSFIAILILVIACINFMNLATARSAERAREVGVRKVMGSLRGQLIAQFLTEAVLLSTLGTAVAIASAVMILPAFNDLMGKQLEFRFTTDVMLGLTGFAMLVGILAGLYPAFALSSYSPTVVMKGSFTSGNKGAWLRNGLVVFQFMISIILIVSTMVVGKQMSFIQHRDLGFDKEQMLMVKRAFALQNKKETFINEVKGLDEVTAAGGSTAMDRNRDDEQGESFHPEGTSEILTVKAINMDDEFAATIGFELRDGRFFSNESNDSLHIILNEAAVRTMDLNDPIGQKLMQTDQNNDGTSTSRSYTILGVVKDFHFQSLRDEITPLVIYSTERFGKQVPTPYIGIRLKPGQIQTAIAKIESKWKELVPEQPFKYEFLDDNLNNGYAEEQRSGRMFAVFSGLAIIIACVGLFGLSAYTASLRTKEIGIRKVLGSSVPAVVILLSKEFTKLVFFAFILAVPAAWWMMDSWLGSFAFRIDLTADSFIAAGLAAVAIAWITVSYQSIKAAIVNPVKSLKGE